MISSHPGRASYSRRRALTLFAAAASLPMLPALAGLGEALLRAKERGAGLEHLRRFEDLVVEVPVDDPGIIFDVDSPEDYDDFLGATSRPR